MPHFLTALISLEIIYHHNNPMNLLAES